MFAYHRQSPLSPRVSDAEPMPLRVALGGASGLSAHHRHVAPVPRSVTQAGVEQRQLRSLTASAGDSACSRH